MDRPTDAAKALGDAVKRRREALGLSQRQLAQGRAFSVSWLRALERGDYPSPQEEKLYSLDDALGVDHPTSLNVLRGNCNDYPPLPRSLANDLAVRITDLDEHDIDLVQRIVGRLAAS